MKSRKSGVDLRDVVRASARKSGPRKSAAARHSSATPDWGTPDWLVDVARVTMGGIDLDPASSAAHNRRVKARRIFTAEQDGLALGRRWSGRVFLNPPGDQSGVLVKRFWQRLLAHWRMGDVAAAVWVGFSLEQLVSLQKPVADGLPTSSFPHYRTPLDFPTCILKRRVRFMNGDASRPSHGNYITLLTHGVADGGARDRFRALLATHGQIVGG